MLGTILCDLKENEGPLSINTLAEKYDYAPEMIEQILETLVRQGKLTQMELPPSKYCTNCTDCPILEQCIWVPIRVEIDR